MLSRGLGCLAEVEVLLRCPATDELGLRSPDVDVLVEDLGSSLWRSHGLGDADLLVDVSASLLVESFEFLLRSNVPVQDVLLEAGNGVVGGAHALDLLTSTVGSTGVGHGVTTVAVGNVLQDHGSGAVLGELLAVLDGGLDGEDVHTIDLETRDVLSALVVVGQGGGPSGGGTHTVLVVCDTSVYWLYSRARGKIELTLAPEKGGQLPELGHVESLEDLTLVGGTITVQDDSSILPASVLVGESETSANGDLGTDDTVTAIETLGEHVHGATLSVRDTLTATEKLSNDGADSGAAHVGVAVASVGGDQIVGLLDGVLDTDGDGFLTSGEMAETTNLLLLV